CLYYKSQSCSIPPTLLLTITQFLYEVSSLTAIILHLSYTLLLFLLTITSYSQPSCLESLQMLNIYIFFCIFTRFIFFCYLGNRDPKALFLYTIHHISSLYSPDCKDNWI
ncbi:hypothetical protein AB205_0144180, partial [Aquarana catesbeiana]